MDDESFEQLFVPVMDTIMNRYQPDAIVLQSGELGAMWQRRVMG
jgi:acetoin utilization deacetylase AcuC-like enzyme